MKEWYSTGEAARLCKTSQQTIIRCFDTGRLHGFRVPGSRFRRIPRDELVRFMRENGIPTDGIERKKNKILLVEDNAQLAELMADAFHRDGRFEVILARGGFEAGLKMHEHQPEALVLDVMSIGINGVEVCQKLRQDPRFQNVYVICISGRLDQREVNNLLAAGANDHLAKPFDAELLRQRVCRGLHLSTTRQFA